MSHLIPNYLLDSITAAPSDTKTAQVASMQNYIQELLGGTHNTFLQGSYKNDTAISDINDVDIVATRVSTYSSVHSQRRFPASIPWESIFGEIEQKLSNQRLYEWTVTRGDKCIKIRGSFNADVIPAVQVNDDHRTDPLVVYSFRTFTEKLNYPRAHYYNGVQKNQVTNGRYKPTVRMFKNWVANHFGENKEIMSSFKMEALVYGADNAHFYEDPATSFIVIADETLKRLNTSHIIPTSILSVCGMENIVANWSMAGRAAFQTQLTRSLQYALAAYRATTKNAAEVNWQRAFNT